MQHRGIGAPGLQHRAWRPAIIVVLVTLFFSGMPLFEPAAELFSDAWLLEWRHTSAVCHGVCAAWSLVMLGAVAARHAMPMWRVRRLRWAGVLLMLGWIVLALSGQVAQYGADGAGRDAFVSAHGWVGVVVLLPFVWHVVRRHTAPRVAAGVQ
ncbi:hypothetical protein [Niveibacterium sp.]|uniref:hypothetical protein n=1 Tax=Niveibacterium sp. TaxID=2017444 RepID=UPI0035AF5EAA